MQIEHLFRMTADRTPCKFGVAWHRSAIYHPPLIVHLKASYYHLPLSIFSQRGIDLFTVSNQQSESWTMDGQQTLHEYKF